MGLQQYLKVVICSLILTDLTGFVKFCVIEVFKFWVRSLWMTEYGVARA